MVREQRINRGLDAALASAEERAFDPARERIVIFSDHHRGAGDGADDFRNCVDAYVAALRHYLDDGYRLFLLGDVEELWEQRAPSVLRQYPQLLALEAEFARRGNGLERFWGNHDDDWASPRRVRRHLGDLTVREALVLRVADGRRLFFVHGHQGSRLSDRLGWFSREIVRFFWRPLQRFTGITATTPARSFALRERHDRALYEWAATQESLVMIAGHTHHPVFAALTGDAEAMPCYFNTGCCSFPDAAVTGLELADGELRLVRWQCDDLQRRVLASESLEAVLDAVSGYPASGREALPRDDAGEHQCPGRDGAVARVSGSSLLALALRRASSSEASGIGPDRRLPEALESSAARPAARLTNAPVRPTLGQPGSVVSYLTQ